MRTHYCLACILLFYAHIAWAQSWKKLAPPVEGKKWVQAAQGEPAQPVWGHKNGLRIGLSPLPGPRGLIRIYTPYLGHKSERVMNFLAMEPIVAGSETRGLSELEMSALDKKRGKRFWSSNDSLQTNPLNELFPASGVIESIEGREMLTVFVFCEAFESGAKTYVRLRFYEDRPHEVEIKTYSQVDSRQLDNFIVTATMGNFARLRTLYLKNKTIASEQLWPNYQGDAFTPHAHFSSREWIRDKKGNYYFIAAPNEANPSQATYVAGTAEHWKYYGRKGVQYWMVNKNETGFEGLVNGRYTYWASKAPIPGGISFENFEIKAIFKQGLTMVFGVSPLSSNAFMNRIKEKE